MLVKDVVSKTTQFLKDKGSDSPRLDSELLISAALNWDRMKIYLNYDYPLTDQELTACREFVRRRATGEPVAYILGKKDFYKNSFAVSPAVLVPRPETELLVDETLAWIKANSPSETKIVDLGTGTGCIGLSLLAELPDARLYAVDQSAGAVAIANGNAERLLLSDRAKIVTESAEQVTRQDLEEFFGSQADVVVANPPYIATNDPAVEARVKLHEPSEALFSGEDGLAHLRSWSEVAIALLRPSGWLMFEIGHEQGQAASEILNNSGAFMEVTIKKDLSGRDRFICAMRAEET